MWPISTNRGRSLRLNTIMGLRTRASNSSNLDRPVSPRVAKISAKTESLQVMNLMTRLTWVHRHMLMAAPILVRDSLARNTDTAFRYGPIPQDTKACGRTIKPTDMVC